MTTNSTFWYLASYPKSGNTWLRILIKEYKRLYAVSYGKISSAADPGSRSAPVNINNDINTGAIASSRDWLDDQIGINSCNLSYVDLDPLRCSVGHLSHVFSEDDRYHKVHDAFTSPQSRGRSIVCPDNCSGAIYIIRNPEDVVVSLAHHMGFSLEDSVAFMLNRRAKMAGSEISGYSQVRQFLGTWAMHVVSWTNQQLIPLHLVRYEDLLQDGVATFSRIIEFLCLPFDLELVKEALANTSINRLQKQEELLGGFVEAGAGERFFRSGKSGEGKEKLTPDQISRIQHAFSDLMCHFNYYDN